MTQSARTSAPPALDPETLASLLDALEGVAYYVDAQGCIRALGQAHWQAFARENQAFDLVDPDRVLGRPLLDFIQGDEVRRSYDAFLATLREGRREAVRFEFGCGAPETDRRMRMCISAIRDGPHLTGFLFQSLVLEEHSRPPVDLFDPAVIKAEIAANADRPIVRLCSYCQKLSDDSGTDGDWISAEAYYRRGGTSQVRISHAICPDCRHRCVDSLIG